MMTDSIDANQATDVWGICHNASSWKKIQVGNRMHACVGMLGEMKGQEGKKNNNNPWIDGDNMNVCDGIQCCASPGNKLLCMVYLRTNTGMLSMIGGRSFDYCIWIDYDKRDHYFNTKKLTSCLKLCMGWIDVIEYCVKINFSSNVPVQICVSMFIYE